MKAAVLVTGGEGYIGSHTCKALAAAGYLPVTIDNVVYGHEWAVRWGPFVRGDVGDTALLERVMAARVLGYRHHRVDGAALARVA